MQYENLTFFNLISQTTFLYSILLLIPFKSASIHRKIINFFTKELNFAGPKVTEAPRDMFTWQPSAA